MRTPSVLLSRNNSARNFSSCSRPRQNRKQRAGTVLLHLHRRGEDIERALGQRQIDDVADELRIQVVEVRFQDRDLFLAQIRSARLGVQRGSSVSPTLRRSTLGWPEKSRAPAP